MLVKIAKAVDDGHSHRESIAAVYHLASR